VRRGCPILVNLLRKLGCSFLFLLLTFFERRNQPTKQGYKDWKHLYRALEQHEKNPSLLRACVEWIALSTRLAKTIDAEHHKGHSTSVQLMEICPSTNNSYHYVS